MRHNPMHQFEPIRVGLDALPLGTSGVRIRDYNGLAVARALHDILAVSADSNSVSGGILDSWECDERGTKHFLKVQHGLHWSDGSTLDARHVVRGLNHAIDRSLVSNKAIAAAFWWKGRRSLLTVRDNYHIELTTPRAHRLLGHLLTLPQLSPIADNANCWSGPYVPRQPDSLNLIINGQSRLWQESSPLKLKFVVARANDSLSVGGEVMVGVTANTPCSTFQSTRTYPAPINMSRVTCGRPLREWR